MPKIPLLESNEASIQGPPGTAIQIGTQEVDAKEFLDASSLPVLCCFVLFRIACRHSPWKGLRCRQLWQVFGRSLYVPLSDSLDLITTLNLPLNYVISPVTHVLTFSEDQAN